MGPKYRRPQRPDRVEFDPDKTYRLPNPHTVARDPYETGYNELEAIAYWILRDDLESIDPETGKKRGLRGDDPILFPEHVYQRRRREILNKNGAPDPSLQEGMYWKPHPEGRKVNSVQSRKAGSGYFR